MDYATLLYLSATAKNELRIPPNTTTYRLFMLPDVSLLRVDSETVLDPPIPIEHDEVCLELVEDGMVKIWAGYSKRTDTLVLSACSRDVDA